MPVLNVPGRADSVQDAKEGFLVELTTFQLLMKKSAMICEAEARQVEEYQKEKEHLGACFCAQGALLCVRNLRAETDEESVGR